MTIITRTPQLLELCEEIDAGGRFALDLEFIPERTYEAELCLVQVATDSDAFIIDPIALRDLGPIWERVADPNILTVLHAAEQDLDLAYGASDLLPTNVMDTQIAAGFVGFGYPVGYGKLLQQLLGITISKTESYTDWMNRPLSKSQVEYALDDVRHLLPMYDRLASMLSQLNRLDWVQEECRRYCDQGYYERDRSNDFFRIKGANSLNRRGLAVLRELSDWRHAEAYRLNRPLRSILPDAIMLEFARRPPRDLSDIQRIRGIRPDQVRQYGTGLMRAVAAGLVIADADCPRWPSAKVPSKRDMLTADILFTVLRVICFDLDIAPELVATRSILEALVRQHGEGALLESTLPILKGWRFDSAGKDLVLLLDGAVLSLQLCNEGHPVAMQFQAQPCQSDLL